MNFFCRRWLLESRGAAFDLWSRGLARLVWGWGVICCRRLSPVVGVSISTIATFPYPRSSNRTCGLPASGFRSKIILTPTAGSSASAIGILGRDRSTVACWRNARIFPSLPNQGKSTNAQALLDYNRGTGQSKRFIAFWMTPTLGMRTNAASAPSTSTSAHFVALRPQWSDDTEYRSRRRFANCAATHVCCLIISVWRTTPHDAARSFYNELKRCAADAPSAIATIIHPAGITVAAAGNRCPDPSCTGKRAQPSIETCPKWIKFDERRVANTTVVLARYSHCSHNSAREIVLCSQQKLLFTRQLLSINTVTYTEYNKEHRRRFAIVGVEFQENPEKSL